MADATTQYYGWSYPTVGGDSSSWGGTLNTTIQAIDSALYGVSQTASGAMPRSGGSFSGGVILNGAAASGGGGFLYMADPSNNSARVTVSSAAPSGSPNNGDVWFQHS